MELEWESRLRDVTHTADENDTTMNIFPLLFQNPYHNRSSISRDTLEDAYKRSHLYYIEKIERTSYNERSANEGINGCGEARVQVAEHLRRDAA